MSIDNDEVFSFILDEEFEKIPFIFRFSKRRIKITLTLLGILFAGMCICSSIFGWMNGALIIIVAGCITAAVAGWMCIAAEFEKRAFRKASAFVYKYRIAEHERGWYKAQASKLGHVQ